MYGLPKNVCVVPVIPMKYIQTNGARVRRVRREGVHEYPSNVVET